MSQLTVEVISPFSPSNVTFKFPNKKELFKASFKEILTLALIPEEGISSDEANFRSEWANFLKGPEFESLLNLLEVQKVGIKKKKSGYEFHEYITKNFKMEKTLHDVEEHYGKKITTVTLIYIQFGNSS